MKKIPLLLLLLQLTYACYSQNAIGVSYKTILSNIKSDGYLFKEDITKEGLPRITANDDLLFQIFYFDKSNRCVSELKSYGELTYNDYESGLLVSGWVHEEGFFYKGNIKAQIKKSENFWFVFFKEK